MLSFTSFASQACNKPYNLFFSKLPTPRTRVVLHVLLILYRTTCWLILFFLKPKPWPCRLHLLDSCVPFWLVLFCYFQNSTKPFSTVRFRLIIRPNSSFFGDFKVLQSHIFRSFKNEPLIHSLRLTDSFFFGCLKNNTPRTNAFGYFLEKNKLSLFVLTFTFLQMSSTFY